MPGRVGGARTLFGFVPLSATEMTAVVVIVGAYIVATEVAKVWFFRHENASPLSSATDPGGQD